MAAAARAVNFVQKRRALEVKRRAREASRRADEDSQWGEDGSPMAPAPRVLADEPQGARPTGFFYFQPSVRAFYEGNVSQVTVAMLITANFLCNVVEKEIDPQGVIMPGTWRKLEITFNVMFLIELIINMYARWLKRFWCDSWNIFDVLVVTVGCISFGVEVRRTAHTTHAHPHPHPHACTPTRTCEKMAAPPPFALSRAPAHP